MSQLPRGWGWPINARKAHYFSRDDIRSLCGKWAYSGPRTDSTQETDDDCSDCQKRRRKLLAKEPSK